MVRPRKPRRVSFDPNVKYFKPRAIPLSALEEVDLGSDELEAIRLCDFEGLEGFYLQLERRLLKL